MNCAEDALNMGVFYNSKSHSKWLYFQIPNTHTSGHFYIGVAPPPPPREKKRLIALLTGQETNLISGMAWEPIFPKSFLYWSFCIPYAVGRVAHIQIELLAVETSARPTCSPHIKASLIRPLLPEGALVGLGHVV